MLMNLEGWINSSAIFLFQVSYTTVLKRPDMASEQVGPKGERGPDGGMAATTAEMPPPSSRTLSRNEYWDPMTDDISNYAIGEPWIPQGSSE
jgi:hypothetical protein